MKNGKFFYMHGILIDIDRTHRHILTSFEVVLQYIGHSKRMQKGLDE